MAPDDHVVTWPREFKPSPVLPILMSAMALVALTQGGFLWNYLSSVQTIHAGDWARVIVLGVLSVFCLGITWAGITSLIAINEPILSLHREGLIVRWFGNTAIRWDELDLADYRPVMFERHLFLYFKPEVSQQQKRSRLGRVLKRVGKTLGDDSDLWIPEVWLRDHPEVIMDVLRHFAVDSADRDRLPPWPPETEQLLVPTPAPSDESVRS